MTEFDLVIRGGSVVTASETFRADIGIRGERIAAIGEGLAGQRVIYAAGLLVMPGGVDSHCHIEQLRQGGGTDEESFVTGSTAAFAGGTTSVVTFSSQFRGGGILQPLAEYRRRAAHAMVDYAFHQIITDPTDAVIAEEIPAVVASGVRSLKVFLTYDPLHLDDRQYLRVLAAARRAGALVTVHCENYDAIQWRTEALLARRAHRAEIPRLGPAPPCRSGRRPIAPSRSPRWWTSRSRCSTSPARRSPPRSPRAQARGA